MLDPEQTNTSQPELRMSSEQLEKEGDRLRAELQGILGKIPAFRDALFVGFLEARLESIPRDSGRPDLSLRFEIGEGVERKVVYVSSFDRNTQSMRDGRAVRSGGLLTYLWETGTDVNIIEPEKERTYLLGIRFSEERVWHLDQELSALVTGDKANEYKKPICTSLAYEGPDFEGSVGGMYGHPEKGAKVVEGADKMLSMFKQYAVEPSATVPPVENPL